MKVKREPKRGDRCEHAVTDRDTLRKSRDCDVRHLEGRPPGLLVVRLYEGKASLLCSRHCMQHEAPNVRRQKPRRVDAVAMAMPLAEMIDINHRRIAEIDVEIERYFAVMPEGI